MTWFSGIFNDLIKFWEETIKNKLADGDNFEKNSHPKNFWMRYVMNRWLDRNNRAMIGYFPRWLPRKI